jgi:serine protease Do
MSGKEEWRGLNARPDCMRNRKEGAMNHLFRSFAWAALGAGAVLSASAPLASAQALNPLHWLKGSAWMLAARSNAPGYLGVDLADVDNEKAQSLRLKEARGAMITLIDHDAPAGCVGLRVNDVILAVDGQNIENAEQMRRLLRQSQVGRKLSLSFSRDGVQQNLTVQLADRKAIEQSALNRIGSGPGAAPQNGGGNSMLSSGSRMVGGSGDSFSAPSLGGGLNVGVAVEPLTAQMASYLGLSKGGVMIKQVARKSAAEAAGLKEYDVVLKLGSEPVVTASDWERALRTYVGRQATVTILRDKKQLTLTLQVDSKRG